MTERPQHEQLNAPLEQKTVAPLTNPPTQQKKGTLAFWDDYHEREPSMEWVLLPTTGLLQQLVRLLPTGRSPRVLEIGCGTSRMALDLFRQTGGQYLVTDVSPVCIEQNQQRDADEIRTYCHDHQHSRRGQCRSGASDQQDGQDDIGVDEKDDFRYQVLNMLDSSTFPPGASFDVVLDKGCLDTLLFRSPLKQHNQLAARLLNNLCTILAGQPSKCTTKSTATTTRTATKEATVDSTTSPTGLYLVMSPRQRLRQVRDFPGFSSVERITLDGNDPNSAMMGRLDGASKDNTKCFLYICRVDRDYVQQRLRGLGTDSRNNYNTHDCQSNDDLFQSVHNGTLRDDDDQCPHCGMLFLDFRKGQDLSTKGRAYWTRTWNGHRKHCKGR